MVIMMLPTFIFAQSPGSAPIQAPFNCINPNSTVVPESILPSPYQPICTDPNQIKYLKVAIHYLLPENFVTRNMADCTTPPVPFTYYGPGNFSEYSDGTANHNYNGFMWAEDLVKKANYYLDNNSDQWRKANNPDVQTPPNLTVTYPATPPTITFRYLLSGVYFHRDNDAYSITDGDWNLAYQKYIEYGVDRENTINIFSAPNIGGGGFANFGGSSKHQFIDLYDTYLQPTCKDWAIRGFASLINHETGHNLSLSHTWEGFDGCDDTPLGFPYVRWMNHPTTPAFCLNQNANCWSYQANIPVCTGSPLPCDTWNKISNNVMDYNEHDPYAFTTCQIGRINNDLVGVGNQFVYSCQGCMPAISFFAAAEEYNMCPAIGSPSIVINAQASFNETTWLLDICEVNPLNPSVCLANNLNTGWITSTLGKVDLLDYFTLQPDKTYRVKLSVSNNNCPQTHEFSKLIKTKDCEIIVVSDPMEDVKFRMQYNNPTEGDLFINYETLEYGNLQLNLVNLFTGHVVTVLPLQPKEAGIHQLIFNMGSMTNGNYALQAVFKQLPYTKSVIKQ